MKFGKKSNVIVKYLEKETNKVLAEEVEITGYEGETYETSRKPIEYYNSAGQTYEDNTPYDETSINGSEVTIPGGENVILIIASKIDNLKTVEFERIPTKLVVEYIDVDTNERINTDKEINGYVGDEYNEDRIKIDSYIPADKPTENNKGIMTEDTIRVIFYYTKQFEIITGVIEHMELVENPVVNMKVEKEFSSIEVNGVEKLESDKKLAKIDISNTEISETSILVKYKIVVTNTEELAGKVKLIENIPVGFRISDLTSANWKNVNGKLQLVTRELQPGESEEYEVVLEWNTDLKCIGNLENVVEIAESENEAGFGETTLQDNKDRCTLILSVRTGENRDIKTIISIACFVLAGICSVVYVGLEIYNRKKNNA